MMWFKRLWDSVNRDAAYEDAQGRAEANFQRAIKAESKIDQLRKDKEVLENLSKRMCEERDEDQAELDRVRNDCSEGGKIVGELRSALADLQARHSTLVHAINDAAMLANEHDPATDCSGQRCYHISRDAMGKCFLCGHSGELDVTA